jgi:hypothetical protein
MHQPVMDPRTGGEVDIEEARKPADSSLRLVAVAEARGVVRDVLAAVRNLEHLLRSPRVGPRALGQVIPGLKGFCDPLLISVDQILAHIRAAAERPVDAAVIELGAFVQSVCERLRASLSRASGAAMDAKSRLRFEGAIVTAGAELNSVRQLLDLLIRATERSDTELYIDEVVRVAFSAPPRSTPRAHAVTVVASYSRDASGFHASPQVVMPLIAAGVAMVQAAPSDRIFLAGVCREDEPVVITISRDCPVQGEEYAFEPPLVIPPMLVCVETAARLASGTFEADRDTVVISWPRQPRT